MKTIGESLKEMGLRDKVNENLKKSFSDAKKNPDFKEFINKIYLSDNELMKYTSLIESSLEEYNNCKNCKSILECKNKVRGHAYLPKVVNNNLEFSYKACKYKEKLIKETEHYKYVALYNAPSNMRGADMKKIYTKDSTRLDVISWLMKYLENYPNNKKGLYLHGNFGSGKTYLISAMFMELAKKGYYSTIIFFPEFLTEIKGTFANNQDSRDLIYDVKTTKLLLIDDLGAENMTAWVRDEVLSPILQYRMDNKLPTFFTSNLSLKDLENHLRITKDGDEVVKARRIIERIKELTESLELVSKNLRD